MLSWFVCSGRSTSETWRSTSGFRRVAAPSHCTPTRCHQACAPTAQDQPPDGASQWHGVSKNAIAKCRVQTGFGHHIDSTTEQFFGVHQKATQSERAGAWAQCHQQIDIAVVIGIATTHRAKDTNSGHPPPESERDEFVAMGLEDWMHQLKFSHSSLGR